MEKESKINGVLQETFKNLRELADVNTIIGQPYITPDGEQIFPISKIIIGVVCGGGEYGKMGIFTKNKDFPFSVGNGSIISVKPCGFLIKNNCDYKIVSMGTEPFEKLIDKTSELIEKIKEEDEK